VVATWQFVDTTKAPVVFCVWKWICGWDFRFVDGASPEWTGNGARFVLNVSRAIHIDSCSYKAIGVNSHYTINGFSKNVPENENENDPFPDISCNVELNVFPKFPLLSLMPVVSVNHGGWLE
jgi:hypothetical protein